MPAVSAAPGVRMGVLETVTVITLVSLQLQASVGEWDQSRGSRVREMTRVDS